MRRDSRALSWLAGYFEGEGTVTLTTGGRKAYTRLVVMVTSTDAASLVPFNELFQVPTIQRRSPPTPRARESFVWRRSNRKAVEFLLALRPYFRTERVKAKVALGLEAQAARRRGNRVDPAGYQAKQRDYFRRMKALNHRGSESGPGTEG